MAPRLGHKKSRNGCVSCKRRRVKCDEKKPCGACARYGWRCSLTGELSPPPRKASPQRMSLDIVAANNHHFDRTDPDAVSPMDRESSLGMSSLDLPSAGPSSNVMQLPLPPLEAQCRHSPPPPLSETSDSAPAHALFPVQRADGWTKSEHWLQDLELFFQYCTSTWQTFHNTTQYGALWQIKIPRIAFGSEYLMHGLLALASLHLAHLQPAQKKKFYIISNFHQNLSLATFRSALLNVTKENADAILAASIVVALFAFASSAIKASDPQESFTMNDVAELLVLMRGIEETLSAGRTREWVSEGPLASILESPVTRPQTAPRPISIFTPHIEETKKLIELKANDFPNDVIVGVKDALRELEITYEVMLSQIPVMNSGLVMRWPNCLSMAYLGLTREGNPLALIVLSLFCAMLHFHEERWVWNRWGARVLGLVKQMMDQGWHKWVDEAQEMIDKDLKYRDDFDSGYELGSRSKLMAWQPDDHQVGGTTKF